MNTMPPKGVYALKACTGSVPNQSDSEASAAESENIELQPAKQKKSVSLVSVIMGGISLDSTDQLFF